MLVSMFRKARGVLLLSLVGLVITVSGIGKKLYEQNQERLAKQKEIRDVLDDAYGMASEAVALAREVDGAAEALQDELSKISRETAADWHKIQRSSERCSSLSRQISESIPTLSKTEGHYRLALQNLVVMQRGLVADQPGSFAKLFSSRDNQLKDVNRKIDEVNGKISRLSSAITHGYEMIARFERFRESAPDSIQAMQNQQIKDRKIENLRNRIKQRRENVEAAQEEIDRLRRQYRTGEDG